MDIENNFIKPVLLFHFSKGKSETEAHRAISKQYGQYAITLKTIYKWFKIFSIEYDSSIKAESFRSLEKLPDELLTDFINGDNGSKFNFKEIERTGNCSKLTISSRLSHISSNSGKVNNFVNTPKTRYKKLSDEFLINLINGNPDLNMSEIAKIAGTSQGTISRKLKLINSDGERIKYIPKRNKSDDHKTCQNSKAQKFTDEYLINLVNENPDCKLKDLAELADASITTISNRLRQINSEGGKIYYCKKTPRSPNLNLTDEFLINLVNDNPNLNMQELAKLAGTSQGTISRKLKLINSEGEKVKYISKRVHNGGSETCKLKTKFSNEFLINLINKNPDLNMEELAKLANVSQGTISNRLKQINSDGQVVNYSCKRNKWRSKNSQTSQC